MKEKIALPDYLLSTERRNFPEIQALKEWVDLINNIPDESDSRWPGFFYFTKERYMGKTKAIKKLVSRGNLAYSRGRISTDALEESKFKKLLFLDDLKSTTMSDNDFDI